MVCYKNCIWRGSKAGEDCEILINPPVCEFFKPTENNSIPQDLPKWYPEFEQRIADILVADTSGKIESAKSLFAKFITEQVSRVDAEVKHDFGEPEISQSEYDKWINDQEIYSNSEGIPIDLYILQSYYDTIEQFIKSPQSKATKGVFEVATQTIKKYLWQR